MRCLKSVGWILLISLFAFETFAQNGCKLRKDEDGIKVYLCHVDSSRFKSIVTEFDINCGLMELMAIATDVRGYAKWQFSTLEGKVLKNISPSEKIYHTRIEAPWPVSDRDMVVHMRIALNENEATITADSESGILPEETGWVRVPFSHAQWNVKVKNERQLHVKYVMLIDPGGAVPAWLVNWTCANAPLQSFQKLKSLLEKK
jgi:hypothetical protein